MIQHPNFINLHHSSLSARTASYTADQRIPELAALILQNRDWHKLSADEKRLASLLRERGYIKKSTMHGYVGSAA